MTTLQLKSSDDAQLKYLAKTLRRDERSRARRVASLAVIAAAVVIGAACSHAMMMMHGTGAKRPAAREFGLGPRISAGGLYSATLEPSRELRPRQMQTIRVAIVDREGRAVVGAALTIDGAMPEHGFNCQSRWSDANTSCAELDYLVSNDDVLQRAYKVPSLRNVAERAPYMNAGQFATLGQALDHYNRAPAAPKGHTELKPLGLRPRELRQLAAFLGSLSAPIFVNGEPRRSSRQ